MLLSGYNFRSIADQTGDFSYVIQAKPPNNTGSFSFGLTGDYSINYTLSDGKIYDRNNRFVDIFAANKNSFISGNVKEKYHEFFINGELKFAGEVKPTGKISGFFSDSDGPIGMDIQFFGQIPDFSITRLNTLSSNSGILTGQIANNNPFISFNFFSGEILNSNIPVSLSGINGLPITGNKEFYLIPDSEDFVTGDVDLRFYTNFGNVDYRYSLSGAGKPFVPDSNYYLTAQPFFTNFEGQGGSSPIKVHYSNPDGANIKVSLEYVSGETGQIFRDVSFKKNLTSQAQTEITGSGNFSKLFTGIFSIVDASGTVQTGMGSGYLTGQGFATGEGEISYNYELVLTGLGSGQFSQLTNLQAFSNERFAGFIPYGQGFISKTINDVSGSGLVNGIWESGLIKTGVGRISVDSTKNLPTGEVVLLNDTFSTESFSDYAAYTELISKDYFLTGSGFAGPVTEFGVFDQNFFGNVKKGTYHFEKDFNSTISGFEEIFLSDTLDEIVLGNKPAVEDLSFLTSGEIIAEVEGQCFEESPLFEIEGSFSPDKCKPQSAKAIFSLYRRNPSFTGALMTIKRPSDGVEKDVYFYQDYVNIENIKHFVGNESPVITKWRDQSFNNSIFTPTGDLIFELKKIISTGEITTPYEGVYFSGDWLKTQPLLNFNSGSQATIAIGGYGEKQVISTTGDLVARGHELGDLAFSSATTVGDWAVFAPYFSDKVMAYHVESGIQKIEENGHGLGNAAFWEATTVGGWAVFAPFGSDKVMAYHPESGIQKIEESGHGLGGSTFRNATTVGDWAVFAPRNSDKVMAYHPESGIQKIEESGHNLGDSAFRGATTVGDWAVFAPHDSDKVMAYHPESGIQKIESSGHGLGNTAFREATTVGDWAVFAPNFSNKVMAYHVESGIQKIEESGHGLGNGAFFGATTVGDWAVFAPFGSDKVMAYHPESGIQKIESSGHGLGGSAFWGATTVGDWAVFAPYFSDKVMAYHPESGIQKIEENGHGLGNTPFRNATTVGDWAVFAPYDSDFILTYNPITNTQHIVSGIIELTNVVSTTGYITGEYASEIYHTENVNSWGSGNWESGSFAYGFEGESVKISGEKPDLFTNGLPNLFLDSIDTDSKINLTGYIEEIFIYDFDNTGAFIPTGNITPQFK